MPVRCTRFRPAPRRDEQVHALRAQVGAGPQAVLCFAVPDGRAGLRGCSGEGTAGRYRRLSGQRPGSADRDQAAQGGTRAPGDDDSRRRRSPYRAGRTADERCVAPVGMDIDGVHQLDRGARCAGLGCTDRGRVGQPALLRGGGGTDGSAGCATSGEGQPGLPCDPERQAIVDEPRGRDDLGLLRDIGRLPVAGAAVPPAGRVGGPRRVRRTLLRRPGLQRAQGIAVCLPSQRQRVVDGPILDRCLRRQRPARRGSGARERDVLRYKEAGLRFRGS